MATAAQLDAISDQLAYLGVDAVGVEVLLGDDISEFSFTAASAANQNFLTTSSSVDALADVDTTTVAPVATQVLAWDGTNWVPTATHAAVTVTDSNDIDFTLAGQDVTAAVIVDPNALNLLSSSATGLVALLASVDGHTDVDTTTVAPTTGQYLTWDGTNWVPGTITTPGEYSGSFDASGGAFPAVDGIDGSGVFSQDWFNVTVAGTVDGQAFTVGDRLVATTDGPSTTTFAANWAVITSPAAPVTSVNGQAGVVSLAADDINDIDTTTVAPTVGQVLEWDGANWVPAAHTIVTLTSDGTATGITTGGTTAAPTIDVLLLSADANQDLVTGADGGLHFTETSVVLTTDGTATGVALSGTNDHTVDVTLLSTDARQALSTGTDGGLHREAAQAITDDTLSTTLSTTMQSKLSASLTVDGGQYEITVSYNWTHNAANSDFESEFLIDSAVPGPLAAHASGLLHKQEPKDAAGNTSGTGTSQVVGFSRTMIVTLAAGSRQFDLNYRTDDAVDSSSIWGAAIVVRPL